MTVATFYPDRDVETTSVDGEAGRNGVDEVWGTIRPGAGNSSNDNAATGRVQIHTHATITNDWADFRRFIALFDTSSLPASATISLATFEFVVTTRTDAFSDSISMVTSTPASDTALANADYGQLGTTKQATDLTLASLTVDSATYNAFTLNATGRGNISTSGITKFGIRSTADNDNAEPTWAADSWTQLIIATAEETLSGDKRPKLVVTFTVAVPEQMAGVQSVYGAQQPPLIPTGVIAI